MMKKLLQKIDKSKQIIRGLSKKYEFAHIGFLFNGDKESTILLHIIKGLYQGKIPFKVFRVKSRLELPEHNEFIEKIMKLWHVEIFTLENLSITNDMRPVKRTLQCCQVLKEAPLKNAVALYGLEVLVTCTRLNLNQEEDCENIISKPFITEVDPLDEYDEKDILDYIIEFNVPYCSLYDKGCNYLECAPCMPVPVASRSVERDSNSDNRSEIKDKLMSLGYL